MGNESPRYYASVRRKGAFKQRDVPGSIGVLESREQYLPIGQADPAGPDEDGLALWRLFVHKQTLPGLWYLVDGEFRPAE